MGYKPGMENSPRSRITVQAAGRSWSLERPADLETLWASLDEDEFSKDERLPYWVELWPASLALSEWLLDRAPDIKGRLCLDLGCGLGLTALVGQRLGAKVLAMDYELPALRFASSNARLNACPSPLWTTMDWRAPAIKPKSCAFIWGGDIMYERRFVAPVLDFLEYSLALEGRAWIAEPNRNVYEEFRTALIGRGWASRRAYSCLVDPLHVQKAKVSVTLWELSR